MEKKIAEVFFTFDHSAVNIINQADVGTILRSLGFVPNENEIKVLIAETEFPDHPGNIHISKFIPVIKKMIDEQKMKPSSPEHLLKAFQVLDPEHKGYIEAESFSSLMKATGDPMNEDELHNQMIKVAVDSSEKRIYYEDYIAKLLHDSPLLKSVVQELTGPRS